EGDRPACAPPARKQSPSIQTTDNFSTAQGADDLRRRAMTKSPCARRLVVGPRLQRIPRVSKAPPQRRRRWISVAIVTLALQLLFPIFDESRTQPLQPAR